MNSPSQTLAVNRTAVARRLGDFFELTKPRVVLMILITAFVGFYVGSADVPNYSRLITMLLGVALAAGGTLALNQYMERDTDALMDRTRRRPIPDGRVQPREALWFGAVVAATGLIYLALAVNFLSALVTAFITLSYLVLYTPMKPHSSLCMLVGAVPGALPPVIGWTAARGSFDVSAWVLFAIMFLWQVPHTLAIARLYCQDYAKAGIQFLPVIEPECTSTNRQIISHTAALLVVSLLPTLLGSAGAIYFIVAFVLGIGFLVYGIRLTLDSSLKRARQLLFASLIYLPVLLLVMALDRVPLWIN
jgi:protoheme IX farnesyltransferase